MGIVWYALYEDNKVSFCSITYFARMLAQEITNMTYWLLLIFLQISLTCLKNNTRNVLCQTQILAVVNKVK